MSRAMNLCCLQSFWIWSLCRWVTLDAFQLLDVGAPRTGTQTMYDAMKILNLNPVHSGYLTEVRPALCEYLFRNGSLDDALGVLDGFDAAMDEPFMLMYEEIMAAFPEAKFVLTISDAERWHDNYVELVRLGHTYPNETDLAKFAALPLECTAMRSWGCNFGSPTQEDRDICLQNYRRHNQRVQEIIPPERLLVYNWSDGWAPLAHFLDVAIPAEDFPREHEFKWELEEKERKQLLGNLNAWETS